MKAFILAGSRARGDWDERSDTDCVAFGDFSESEIFEMSKGLKPPVNVIKYDANRFYDHYSEGSLFLHHCFTEGIFIGGDRRAWEERGAAFKVALSFRKEIERYLDNIHLLRELDAFGGLFLPAYVLAYLGCKNCSIFFLASNGRYQFNKNRSIIEAASFVGFSDGVVVSKVRNYYDWSVRGLGVSLPWEVTDRASAEIVISKCVNFMETMSNEV